MTLQDSPDAQDPMGALTFWTCMTSLSLGTVLTRVKTLTRVFEGRETYLLLDSNTTLLLRVDSVFPGTTT